MDTRDLQIFVTAALAGSLSEAARRLNLTPMAASRRLAALEGILDRRLLHRTTRSLALTPEGESFLPFARAMLESENEGLARLRAEEKGAAGLLRVSVPIAFGLKIVAPLIPTLMRDNPELHISLDMTDDLPDLVSSGIDLAIRVARLRDSGLIARRLADNPRYLLAAPSYLASHPAPRRLSDLASHDLLAMHGATHWIFQAGSGDRALRIDPRFRSTSIEACHAACLAGAGLTILSAWNVQDDLAAGRLVRIEPEDGSPEMLGIWAIYPTRQMVLPKVRVFISAVTQALQAAGGDPDGDVPPATAGL